MNQAARHIVEVITAHRQQEGGGFWVRRPFPTHGLMDIDPFLMLDEMGPTNYGPGEAIGAPDHPHRGFETVTYMVEGEMEHKDSAGHAGKLTPGDIQWMTAGSGVVHSELPSQRMMNEGGVMHGFQIWVNLPAKDKMIAPRYQEIPRSEIPEVTFEGGNIRVIAGTSHGVEAVIDTHTPIVFFHVTMEPGAYFETNVPMEQRCFAYVFGGAGTFGPEEEPAEDGQVVLFDSSSEAIIAHNSGDTAMTFLLLGGRPIQEPLARYGPFVMNTKEQIFEAITDFQEGRMGHIEGSEYA